MKIAAIHPAPASGVDQNAAIEETRAKVDVGQTGDKNAIDPEKLRLAKEFEQIFIRKMLSSLEKSGRNAGGASSSSASGDAYGSMVVSALAEAVSKGGGIGLAEVIARAASREDHAPAGASPVAAPAPVVGPGAVAKTLAVGHVGAAPTTIAVPRNVSIAVSPPPNTVTYSRPTPAIITNENHDIQESFKDRKR
jgi:Rod binding domain-containing protein